MNWENLVEQIAPFVVRIQTQFGYGTGYIFWQNETLCCIATANHVISPANNEGWEQPILISQANGKWNRFYPNHRRILQNLEEGDSAAILVHKSDLIFPSQCLPIWDFTREIPIGTNVGWLGFPQIVDASFPVPSFFSGTISNVFQKLHQYAIDGVAIHGVSGGPLFYKGTQNTPTVIGTVSSYFPNTVITEGGKASWPGMSVAHSFTVFSSVVKDLQSLDQIEQNTKKT